MIGVLSLTLMACEREHNRNERDRLQNERDRLQKERDMNLQKGSEMDNRQNELSDLDSDYNRNVYSPAGTTSLDTRNRYRDSDTRNDYYRDATKREYNIRNVYSPAGTSSLDTTNDNYRDSTTGNYNRRDIENIQDRGDTFRTGRSVDTNRVDPMMNYEKGGNLNDYNTINRQNELSDMGTGYSNTRNVYSPSTNNRGSINDTTGRNIDTNQRMDSTTDYDNTRINLRDRNPDAITPEDQSESYTDRTITQRIRQAIMADDSISMNGKNIKIITNNGVVTLRGPVLNEREKKAIALKINGLPGVIRVSNQLEPTRP